MEYVNPIGKMGNKVPYVDADPANGIEGDPVSSNAWEHTMLEIVAAIEAAGLTPDSNDLSQLTSAILTLAPKVPAGCVIWLASAAPAPSGYVQCDGAEVSRSVYADLFSVIGTTFGNGDGSTTFNLPDLRGEFIRGWDDGRGVDAGRVFGSWQADELKVHDHQYHVQTGAYAAGGSNQQNFNHNGEWRETKETGGAETRPRNVALQACIKY